MSESTIAITFALPTESSGFRARLDEKQAQPGLVFGTINEKAVAICHTGVGGKHCNDRMEQLLHKARPTLVISSGFAGAVTEQLQPGELILAENFSDLVVLARAREILSDHKARVVKLFTSASILDSISERNEIARASGAAAVDMETGSISEICKAHGVPLLSLRAITDTPAEPLPAPADVLFDIEAQRTKYGRLLTYLFRHPDSIVKLTAFSRRIAKVRGKLTDALVTLIRDL